MAISIMVNFLDLSNCLSKIRKGSILLNGANDKGAKLSSREVQFPTSLLQKNKKNW